MLTQSTPYLVKAIFGNFTHTLAGVGITPIKVGIAPTEVGITHTVAGIAEDVDFNKKTVGFLRILPPNFLHSYCAMTSNG
jgi:hypothetical protein